MLPAVLLAVGATVPVAALIRRVRHADRPSIDATALRALRTLRGDASLAPPVALLYVSRQCAHCSRAAVRFDSIMARRSLRAVIVTGDPAESAGVVMRWAASLRLRHVALALDTGRHFAHAVALRAVPASIPITGVAARPRYDDIP